MKAELSHRERVGLALQHRQADRVPIAMVCAGLNPPAHEDLEAYLARERGTCVEEYLKPLIDIKVVGPEYVGPPLPVGTDIWSVHRSPVSYGSGSYSGRMSSWER